MKKMPINLFFRATISRRTKVMRKKELDIQGLSGCIEAFWLRDCAV